VTESGIRTALRRPTEADQPRIAAVVDHWFAGRRVWPLVSRAWFRHFAGTSWIIEDTGGRPLGLLIGYRSPDRPTEAVLHLVAVDPNHRRQGLGRALVEAFLRDADAGDASVARAVAWPDDPIAIAFFHSVGFEPEAGPGSQRLYGVTAWPDYELPGEDRAVLVRTLRTGNEGAVGNRTIG
jgi:ribosomal protein S18 acetylase RimI-like enzyme